MPKKPRSTSKAKGRAKGSTNTTEDGEDFNSLIETTAYEQTPVIEKDAIDAQSMTIEADPGIPSSVPVESLPEDDGNGETQYQVMSKKARTVSNLTEEEQEEVALFLERNDFLYNKRRTDHTSVSRKNKAWEDLAKEMGKEVKALITFFESIRTQIGKLRRKKSGQAAVELTERQHWIWTRFQFLMPHIGQVTQRTVQTFRSDISTNQSDTHLDESHFTVITTTPNNIARKSPSAISSNRSSNVTSVHHLDEELQTCKDRQEKLLQILQAPTKYEVPHPERLKFAEYLGHAFQNLPNSIYRDLQKSIFDHL